MIRLPHPIEEIRRFRKSDNISDKCGSIYSLYLFIGYVRAEGLFL